MTWPVTLTADGVTLRPLRIRDARSWREVRRRNHEWLQPWEATLPPEGLTDGEQIPSFGAMVRVLRTDAREGRSLPWAIEFDRHLIGQVTVGGITRGSMRGAHIGYWIDQDYAGRGLMPTAVAMSLDYCLDNLRLHRIEVNIRPENFPSRRVAEKLGLRLEGERPGYLHIAGQWRDHLTYVAFAGDFPHGVLEAYRVSRGG
ncbi:MAG: GNAT family N-acetyltransferase [Actinomycetales bacterium]|nr:GNAT family N-acetyltransferase [Actinomycetales bacterium]